MLKRYGLPAIAVVGLVSLAVLNWALVVRYNEREAAYQAAHKQYEDTKGDLVPGAARDGKRSVADPKSYREEWRSEHDLEAQRDMAKWALFLLLVSGGSLFVTTIGVFYVALTLTETRFSNERQLRAYVAINDANRVRIDRPDRKEWSAHIIFKNYGQTPAYDTRITVYSGMKPRGFDETQLDIARHKKEAAPFYFAPSEIAEATEPLVGFESGWDDFKTQKSAIYIWGRVDYIDAFDKPRWMTFRMYGNYYSGIQFAYCPTGNEAN